MPTVTFDAEPEVQMEVGGLIKFKKTADIRVALPYEYFFQNGSVFRQGQYTSLEQKIVLRPKKTGYTIFKVEGAYRTLWDYLTSGKDIEVGKIEGKVVEE